MPLYNEAIYNETIEAIENVKNLNADSLAKLDDPKKTINFPEAVQLIKDIIGLYLRVSPEALKSFSDKQLENVKENANYIYQEFKLIDINNFLKYSNSEKEKKIIWLSGEYNKTFEVLRDIIVYSVCTATDFVRMEQEAKGVFEKIEAQASKVTKELETNKNEAQRILEEIKQVAVDQAVSKQAIFFKDEGEEHLKHSKFWGRAVLAATLSIIIFAVSTLFFNKISFLKPTNNFEMMQLIAAKLFIFSTLTYLLYICGKNFSNHKHNAILNKHRQNSLMTYKTLVEAAGTSEGKEIILRQAANSIFTHQDTGYIKAGQNDTGKGIMDLLLKKNFKPD